MVSKPAYEAFALMYKGTLNLKPYRNDIQIKTPSNNYQII